MPVEPGLPSAEELAALPHEELAARLAEAYRLIAERDSSNQVTIRPPRRRQLHRAASPATIWSPRYGP